LIPLTWVAAACLPSLWTIPYWLGWKAFGGRLSAIFREVGRWALWVFPAFSLAYLLAAGVVFPGTGFSFSADWWMMVFYQLFYVGLSEELFFRGYLQVRLDEVFGRPYRLWGTEWGLGLLGANLLFTLGHGVTGGDLKHLSVFFPGLLFGWLQARTGATLAPVLFHGLSNILLLTLRSWVSQSAV
jgi:membrane protease YdiL (CAAX protease family)